MILSAIRRCIIMVIVPIGLHAAEIRIEQRMPPEWGTDYAIDPVEALGTSGFVIDDHGTIEELVTDRGRVVEFRGRHSGTSIGEPTASGARYRVYDSRGMTVGTVERHDRVSEQLFRRTRYTIKDRSGNEIALSTEFTGLRPAFTISERNGRVSTIRAIGEKRCIWKLSIHPDSSLDLRLLFALVVAQAELSQTAPS